LNVNGLLGAVAWLAVSIALCPASAADTGRVHKIGVLMPPVATSVIEQGLRQGLREAGYSEGKTLAIDWRRSSGNDDELRLLAAEMARAGAEVILTPGSPATRAALQATTLPVVFEVGDPVAAGFVATLSKPDGRATGVSALATELYPKRLELLHRLAPSARRIGYLRNPENPLASLLLGRLVQVAQGFGLQLEPLDARDAPQIDAVLHALRRRPPDGLLISAELNLLEKKEDIARTVREAHIPTIFPWREYHEAGAAVSYGASLGDLMRRMGIYVDRILKGARPGDLPVEQVSKYDLVVNLRVARAQGLQVPEAFLILADEVIR
jgi:ABC-type uncharacterized transport system substrate-binding protein